MTLAANVASGEQHEMPTSASLAPSGAGAVSPSTATRCVGVLACPHTGEACPALAMLFNGGTTVGGTDAEEWVQRIRPCASCRITYDHGRATLRGVRLGQREREVLIGASRDGAFAVTAPGMTRSLSAARRRAAQGLVSAGLVRSMATSSRGRATVALTPLGDYVMLAYGRFINAGKPVRWDRPSSKVALPGQPPTTLLDETVALSQAALRETLGELKKVLLAAVARPIRDPSQLDRLTRRLEQKADGLRALLEPLGASAHISVVAGQGRA